MLWRVPPDAGAASLAGGKLNELNNVVASRADTGNGALNEILRNLAANSQGKYTAEQIEAQMRLSDVVDMNGKVLESVGPDQLDAATTKPYDSGAQWASVAGTTQIREVQAQGNAEIIAYIQSQQKAMQGDVPYTNRQDYSNVVKYSNSTGQLPTAKCGTGQADCAGGLPASMTEAELQRRRGIVADGADWTSTQLGRVSSSATAIAVNPASPPQMKIVAEGISTITNAAALAASAVEQVVRPDAAKIVTDGALAIGGTALSNRFPGMSPAINEAAETIKKTQAYKDAQEGARNVLP